MEFKMILRIFLGAMLCILAAILGLTACASKRPVIDMKDDDKGNPAFDKGLKALEKENYGEAAAIFDRLLVAKPASESDLVITYDSGAAYEGLGQCPKASERYREVVRASAGKYQQLEGLALYRLSLMYECMGQDTKSITALLDAKKRGKQLSSETLTAEIPARLAAAYARVGNKDKAREYFAEASDGLKKIVTKTQNHKQKELVARTLFLMGQLNSSQRSATVPATSYMQSVSMQQAYLMQAVEMDHPLWSRKASDDLILAYDNIWKFQVGDGEQRRALYTRGLQSIQELRKIRLPNASAPVNAIYAHVDGVEQRLQTELAKVAEFNKLTPDAEKREGLKRQGKLADPVKDKKAKAKR
jgi:tetratricopeptide (TPR) repeat protein